MAVVIKRRVSLDFLGEEYSDAYIILKAIPVSEYDALQKRTDGAKNNLEIIKVMVDVLQENFVAGKFPQEDGKPGDLVKEDIGSFSEDVIAECYEYITGQKTNPKP